MAELDERMHDLAARSLAGGKLDWSAYLVLHVSEERMRREPSDEPSPTDFCACLRDAMSCDDLGRLTDALSIALSTMSELRAQTTGERRQAVIDTCRRIGNLA